MTDYKDFELRVKAKLDGVKDLGKVADAIADVEKAIQRQTDAAKRGENVIDELKGSMEALGAIQGQLKDQLSLVKDFANLSKAVESTQGKIDKATATYDKLNKKLIEKGKLTEREQVSMEGQRKAIESLTTLLEQQRGKLSVLSDSYKSYGIDVSDLAAVEQRNYQIQIERNRVLQQGRDALASYAQTVREARDVERQRTTELQQFEAAERRAAEATKARAKAAEEVSTARSNRAGEVAAQQRADAELVAANKRAQELAALRKDIVDRSTTEELNKLANQAEATSRSYTTLARAADDLTPKQQSLREAINGILDPSKKATSTIDGLEKQVGDLAVAVAKINGPVKNYRESMDKLAAARTGLERQAGLIDTYNREVAALRESRQELVNARSKVAEYAAEVRKGGEAGAQFVKSLNDAQQKAKAAAQGMAEQVARTRESRDALRAAGISTSDLAGSQQRLVGAAQQATGALNGLKAAVTQYGVESEKAERKGGPFSGKGGRTTLDLLQRIRGQVLSLTAAYVGLFGVIGLAKGGVEASNTRDQINNRLALVVGNDPRKIADEYKYVGDQAERVGANFEAAAQSYSKFTVAATKSGASIGQSRFIFESFLETSRVLGMSGDDLNGLFNALGQSFSKGKIQAEELRQQIGERLPGAFTFAQEALKDKFPDLNKALEEGKVGAENLVIIAESVRRAMQDQLGPASKTAAAEQERLNKAIFEFKLAMADSGYLEAYRNAIVEITKFMKSEDGKQFADSLGKGFAAVADGVVWLAKNIDLVTTALKAGGTAWALWKGAQVAAQIPSVVTELGRLLGVLSASAGKVGEFAAAWPRLAFIIKGALGVVSAALIGWEIGTILREKFAVVRQASTWMVTGIAEAFAWLKGAFAVAWDALPTLAKNAMASMLNVMTVGIRKGMSLFAAFASAAGMDGLAKSIEGLAGSLEMSYGSVADATAKARADMQAEVANIRKIRNEMLAEDAKTVKFTPSTAGAGRGSVNPQTVKGGVTAFDPAWMNTKPLGGEDSKTEAALRKRQSQVEEIQRALEALDSKIDRSKTESLQSQLDAIDTQYASLERKITKLGGAEAESFLKRLTQLTNDLRKVTIDKFEQDLVKQQQALDEKTNQLEAASGRKQLLSLESRQAAVRKSYESLYTDLRELRLKFFQNDRDTAPLDAAQGRIDAGVQSLLNLEEQKFKLDELNALEETRANKIKAINEQRQAGIIDEQQAVDQINTINNTAIPAIKAAADETMKWATANAALFANQESLDQFIAKINLIRSGAASTQTEFTNLENSMIQAGVNGVGQGLNMIYDGLLKVATGQQSVAEGFRGMLTQFALFAAQFLRDIAIMIIKLYIFNLMKQSGNPYLVAIGTAGSASMGVKHSGGVIGHGGGRSRPMDASWFVGAPRYHTGGVAGLAPDEYPTILQRGEEVLAKDSPRNILNGGGAQQGGGNPGSMRVVLVDDRARVPEAMAGSEGGQVIVQHIRKNAATIKQFLK